jgi:putative SOS response-associated peptidase YedK
LPVLLSVEEAENWLTGKAGREILRPAAESALREWVVSKRVNKVGADVDDPTLVEAVRPEQAYALLACGALMIGLSASTLA